MNAELARKLSKNCDKYDQLEHVMAQIRVDALSGAGGATYENLTADTIVLLLDRGFQVSEPISHNSSYRLVSW